MITVDSGAVATYVYDAEGNRVQKTNGSAVTQYIFDHAVQVIQETNGVGNGQFSADYIYFGGQLVAEYRNSTTYFAHADHLGSTRVLTDINGSGYDNYDYLPFGETMSGGWGTTHKFTGDERDSETGLDHTFFRQYSSSLGRWSSPDPLAGDISDPQSLNRYGYVSNGPLDFIDPAGTCAVFIGGFTDTPNTDGTYMMQMLANRQSSIQAFPYSGEGIIHSFASSLGSVPGNVAANAILSAASNNSGDIQIVSFSGGAQALSDSAKQLSPSVTSRISSVQYFSPGITGLNSDLVKGTTSTQIDQANGTLDHLATALAPGGSNPTTFCKHSMNCELAVAENMGRFLATLTPCNNPSTFTRSNAAAAPGAGNASGAIANAFRVIAIIQQILSQTGSVSVIQHDDCPKGTNPDGKGGCK